MNNATNTATRTILARHLVPGEYVELGPNANAKVIAVSTPVKSGLVTNVALALEFDDTVTASIVPANERFEVLS